MKSNVSYINPCGYPVLRVEKSIAKSQLGSVFSTLTFNICDVLDFVLLCFGSFINSSDNFLSFLLIRFLENKKLKTVMIDYKHKGEDAQYF